MANEALVRQCGLNSATVNALQQAFSQHGEVERVLLYGSRAKGAFRNGSNIDLTLLGDNLDYGLLNRIEIDDLLLPYTVDLSLFQQIDNPDLIDHIRRIGLIFYPSQ